MLFLPLKADLPSPRFPFVTILIVLMCLFIYWKQVKTDEVIAERVDIFCSAQDDRSYTIVMNKLAEGTEATKEIVCNAVVSAMHYSNDREKTIESIAGSASSFSIMNKKETQDYISTHLLEIASRFADIAPKPLTQRLQYDPGTYDVVSMITSAFAHGSWSHVIGNLFFFFAFAATVEIILGSTFFIIMIATLAIGTNMSYALTVAQTADSLPTLGLSGVVMGMIGMFVYFIPREKIMCLIWVIFIIRRLRIPAWMIASWYVGWDIYDLTNDGVNSSGVNLIAHVSGFILGYLLGKALFSWRKLEVKQELEEYLSHKEMLAAFK